MKLFTRGSPGALTSLLYLTAGSLLMVWSGVWYVYLHNNPPEDNSKLYYYCTGFLATGVMLFVIGLAVGSIGKSARSADRPPLVTVPPVATTVPPVATAVPAGVPVASQAKPQAVLTAADYAATGNVRIG